MANMWVNISGLPSNLVMCEDDITPTNIPNPVYIEAGGSTTITACVIVGCPQGLDMPIAVQGTVTNTPGIACLYGPNGQPLQTSVSQCPACVSCCLAPTCRVTGGGTLYAGDVSINCTNVTTVLFDDLADAAGLTVDHISHGGQLGAPFSQMDCGTRLNNPCIRGEWSHHRHYDNKNNGASSDFDMDFHSANPNPTGHFDTLMCACLPCCSDQINLKPHPPGWDGFKFKVCNPDDRRICGPLPRPAPANAIIFTGIGTFTPQTTANSKKAAKYYVIFRVYIEDRSEPGGIHPGGAKMPGTVYCFQAWNTGVQIGKKGSWDTIMTEFRAALGADSCAFLTAMQNGDLPQGSLPNPNVCIDPTKPNTCFQADVVDQGPLHDGSQQIHPSTGATCTK
jgi:hypothetical protein